MTLSAAEIKQRYFDKKKAEAPEVECACGCGTLMKAVDDYGRSKKYINGHNAQKHPRGVKWARHKAWVKKNRAWVNERRKRIARERKVELINRLGGKCDKCGLQYDGKNGAAFEFHHTGEFEKDFQIGSGLTNRSFEALKIEADKCQLLCANCHQIEHLGEY